jgi:transcriptional regulator with XRE-family HTH domain
MVKKRVKLSDQVRQAVDASGLSRYAICKELGLAQATMSRFMSGKGGLSMGYLDALADMLGLNVTVSENERAKRGSNGGKHQH